jgi:hypothetical protein
MKVGLRVPLLRVETGFAYICRNINAPAMNITRVAKKNIENNIVLVVVLLLWVWDLFNLYRYK